MKVVMALIITTSSVLPALFAQSAPSVTPSIAPPGTVPGVSSGPIAGEFTYALTGSESYVSGYQGTTGSGASTNLSGQAEFVTNSETHPLSVIYSGGYYFGDGSNISSSVFQSLGVSQILKARRWRLGIADSVSFLPSSPLYGVSGVPGSGDIGSTPITTGGIPTQSILTNYGEQISNTVSGSAARDITGKTFINGSGSYSLQRFLQRGINNSDVTASASAGHRFNPLNSLSASYSYAQFNFNQPVSGITNFNFTANGAAANYSHIFSRVFSMQLSGGPQWISSNTPSLIPNRLLFSASVNIAYAGKRTRASATYSRSPNVGSGVLLGALADDINLSVQHTFSTRWSGGMTANYGRASGLATLSGVNALTNSFYGGIQANRRLSENFSAFGSYSAATQNVAGTALAQNVFSGTANIVTVGLTYSPRSIRFGRP
jgi:hypothetical protein